MNNYIYKSSNWESLLSLAIEYISELNGKYDGFYNEMMFSAEPYLIEDKNENIGFISLSDGWDGGKMLTSFYIKPENRAYSDEIISHVIRTLGVTAALVPCSASHFTTLAFEKMRQLETSFELQAYNCIYHKPERPAEYSRECIYSVGADEYKLMNSLTEGQWEECFGDPRFSFYALRDNGTTLGYGCIGKLINDDIHVDIGNFTLPQYRRRGVGRSLLINLAEKAKGQGSVPVAGCWYGNTKSIMTLKSSGFIPESRIFYVKFF